MATVLSITEASWGQIAEVAYTSVSATVNIAVTEWKNAKGYDFLPFKAVKFIATEILYAGVFVLGTLEAVARAVCTVVLIPLDILARSRCLHRCLPECVTTTLHSLAKKKGYDGVLTSLATAFDALEVLVASICRTPTPICMRNDGLVILNRTFASSFKDTPLDVMTRIKQNY
jgi:hypothetical protein